MLKLLRCGTTAIKTCVTFSSRTLFTSRSLNSAARKDSSAAAKNATTLVSVQLALLTTRFADMHSRELKELANMKAQFIDCSELLELAVAERDSDLEAEVGIDIQSLKDRLDTLHLHLAIVSEGGECSTCFVELRAGSGGEEACDWCHILSKMYTKWAILNSFTCTLIDYVTSKEGYKSCTMQMTGKDVYAFLKQEQGVHRFVRVSPFDSQGKRHTSFVSLSATPVDTTVHAGSAKQIEISPKEITIEVMRAQGAGGQHVNKTESAVRIVHIPTGITVFCQAQRSQHQNKALAMVWLQAKLYKKQQLERQTAKNEMYNSQGDIAWGAQIRNYVLTPYQMIKDTRTGVTRHDVNNVLEGDVHEFMEAAVLKFAGNTSN